MLAAYRYSTKGYYNLNDACTPSIRKKIVAATTLCGGKKRHNLHGEPEPAGRLGRVLSSGRISDYWNRSGTEKQYQVSTTIHLVVSPGRRARSASIRRQLRSSSRRSYFTQLQLPAVFGDNRTANLTSNTSFNNSRLPARRLVSTVRWTVKTTLTTGVDHHRHRRSA